MKILGIVAEYNPFHSGHLSHIARSKEISGADAVVVVMSGNFVQRGEPAIADKWRRARSALDAGVDLIIELPLSIATASAGYFAQGAVALLDKTGIVDCICFGSECGDLRILEECAKTLLSEGDDFKNHMREHLDAGLSFPSARDLATKNLAARDLATKNLAARDLATKNLATKNLAAKEPNFGVSLPNTPNDVLGVEYIKALMELSSDIEPFAVLRSPGSAKEIRDAIKANEYSQNRAVRIADLDNLSSVFHFILLTHTNLKSILDVSEGIDNLLGKYARENFLISDIIAAAKTKRYTYLRLQRVVLHMILGITEVQELQYIRILGFRKKSERILRMLEANAKLPVVMNLKYAKLSPSASQMLNDEIRASEVYSLAFSDYVYINEYTMPLIVV